MFDRLEGCILAGSPKTPPLGLAGVMSSLLYQAKALGLPIDASGAPSIEGQISFAIEAPGCSPVTCDVGGWPDPSDGVATEHLIQAACGLMSVHGRSGGGARPLGLNYVSTLAAVLALQGGLAAVLGQSRGAAITRSQTSLAAAAALGIGQYIAGASASEAAETIPPDGGSPAEHPPFVSADGIVFELETLDAEPWRRFWEKAGVNASLAGKGWSRFLLRYAEAAAPLPPALMAVMASMPFAQITAICASAGMAICKVRSLVERAHDKDAEAMWLQGPWSFLPTPDRSVGMARLAASDLPLSGLTVIESCRRIQGPLAGHLLALLGANVLRIEPPGGDPLRDMPPVVDGVSARYDALNRLKSVLEIDIKSKTGQSEIKELARDADVFLHNWAPGKATALNLDHSDLVAVNPSLTYAYAGGWGPAAHIALPGTDFMAQAYSGVANKIAEASGTRGGSLFTALDILGGAIAAQGVTVALLARRLRHASAKVETSLLGAATLLSADDLAVLLRGRDPSQGAAQNEDPMIKAVYPTRKGRIAIECRGANTIAQLTEALGLASIDLASIGAAEEIERHFGPAFLSRTAADWMHIFGKRGIPAEIVIEDLRELGGDARMASCFTHGSCTKVNSPWRFT